MASTISFAGMASGLDTDAIVEAMVSNYKSKADNSAKQQLLLEWKQDIYKDVSKKVYSFYTGIASKLRLESTFNKKLLTTSNTTAIKLDNTSTVPSGTHTLTDLKMATSAQMQTYKIEKKFDGNTTMNDLGMKVGQSITISEGEDKSEVTTTISFVSKVPEGKDKDENTIYLTLKDNISYFETEINKKLSSAEISFDGSAQAFSISREGKSEKKTLEISGETTILENLGLPSSKIVNSSSESKLVFKQEDVKVEGKNISNMTSVSSTTAMSALGVGMDQSITISSGIGDSQKTIAISFVDEVPKPKAENTIYLISSDKISDLQSALKEAMPSASVNFDSKAGAFFISSSTTGANQQFQISGSTEVLQKLGLTDGGEKSEDINGNSVKNHTDEVSEKEMTTINMRGSDAEYTYNGIEMTSSSNNVSVNGLKFTITSNTKTTVASNVDMREEIIISSNPDVEGMASTIKSFVEEYNTLISELNELIDAPSAGSYEPLLDDEKEGMTDSQIEKWEKKIKDSLLRNDSTLKSLTSNMRSILSSTLSTNLTYKSLSSIGITTSSDWTANGKLELDEDKLKEALTNNADEIIALFSANSKKETSDEQKDEDKNKVDTTKGLGDRIYDALGDGFKRIANVKSATSLFSDTLLTKQRATQAETTNKLEDRLEKMREIYLKRFTAMETAMSKLNSQTDSLTSLLSS